MVKVRREESRIVYICSTVNEEAQVLYTVRLFSLYCKNGAFLILYRWVVHRGRVTYLVLKKNKKFDPGISLFHIISILVQEMSAKQVVCTTQ